MKHVIMTDKWTYGEDPFPAYRCSLIYGRNKRDFQFLPVKDITPPVKWTCDKKEFTSQKEAEEYKTAEYERRKNEPLFCYSAPEVDREVQPLPENKFKIIKTKEKGTILIVPGVDESNRILLFGEDSGGFRGDCGIKEEETTGKIIKSCNASNNCESGLAFIALLEKGERVVTYSYGRRCDDIKVFLYNGDKVEVTNYTKSEWEALNSVNTEEVEEL